MKELLAAILLSYKSECLRKILISGNMISITMRVYKIFYWLVSFFLNLFYCFSDRICIHFRINHKNTGLTYIHPSSCTTTTLNFI